MTSNELIEKATDHYACNIESQKIFERYAMEELEKDKASARAYAQDAVKDKNPYDREAMYKFWNWYYVTIMMAEVSEVLQSAKNFIAGFEDDETQEGINELLHKMRITRWYF